MSGRLHAFLHRGRRDVLLRAALGEIPAPRAALACRRCAEELESSVRAVEAARAEAARNPISFPDEARYLARLRARLDAASRPPIPRRVAPWAYAGAAAGILTFALWAAFLRSPASRAGDAELEAFAATVEADDSFVELDLEILRNDPELARDFRAV